MTIDAAPQGTDRRRTVARVLLVLGSVAVLVASLAGWVRWRALSTDDTIAALRPVAHDEEVTDAVAVALTDRIMTEVVPADTGFLDEVLEREARDVVLSSLLRALRSDRFEAIWVGAVERAHQRLLDLVESGDTAEIALDLGDALERVASALQDVGIDVVDPGTIDRVDDVAVADAEAVDRAGRVLRLVDRLAVPSILAAVVLLVATLAVAPDRRRAVAGIGVGVMIVMAVAAGAVWMARRVVLDQVAAGVRRDAADDVWSGLVASLHRELAVIFVIGLGLAVGAWLVGRREVLVGRSAVG